MLRSLGKFVLMVLGVLVSLAIFVLLSHMVQVDRADSQRAEQEAQAIDDRNAHAYAVRLRADGDRLAKEGEWEDALARYNQAINYDRSEEGEAKLRVIREHVGEVVFDKEFEARGAAP